MCAKSGQDTCRFQKVMIKRSFLLFSFWFIRISEKKARFKTFVNMVRLTLRSTMSPLCHFPLLIFEKSRVSKRFFMSFL